MGVPVAWPGFCGGSNVSQSPSADQQELINFYPEPRDVAGDTSPMKLYPTPGAEVRATSVKSPGRAIFEESGRTFAVIGDGFYELTEVAGSSDLTLTLRDTVAVDANPATICSNGDGGGQLLVTSGGNAYCYDLKANTLTLVLSGTATMGAFRDGYGIVLNANTATFYVSDLLDFSTWDPTQYAQRSIASDRWVSLVCPRNTREIWLLGEKTTEVWQNTGAFPFPFEPVANALFPFGCAAPFSVVDVDGTLLWVAQRATGHGDLVAASGGAPQVVSTFAQGWAFDEYERLSDAIGAAYGAAGHVFYLLTFPTDDVTWGMDLRTKMPFRLGTWRAGAYEAWRPRFHTFAWGRHLAVDGESGAVYEMHQSYGTDVDGLPLRRVRRTPALFADKELVSLACVELILEAGLGKVSGAGVAPAVSMRLSKDGGKTWGNERMRDAGAIGQFDTRVRWWRCGSGRQMVGEFVVTDPIPWRILGATVRLPEGGA